MMLDNQVLWSCHWSYITLKIKSALFFVYHFTSEIKIVKFSSFKHIQQSCPEFFWAVYDIPCFIFFLYRVNLEVVLSLTKKKERKKC